MKKTTLLSVIAVLIFVSGYSQKSLWAPISDSRIASEKLERTSTPTTFQLFQLDLAGLKTLLQTAPSRENATTTSPLILAFPNADGKTQRYHIYEASVMAPELAARHPEIQSYVGKGIDDPTASIHLTTTIFGLHAMTLSANGTYYIDPYTKDLKNYIAYKKSGLKTTADKFSCGFIDEKVEGKFSANQFPNEILASDGKFRTYRLAMACTVEYATVHINAANAQNANENTKKAAVLAAMNVTVARVNSVYERDMSLRMQLIANNTNLIFVTTDNFDNTNTNNALLGQSQSVITNAIGNANFDLGHTVSTGGGGVAGLGVVCINGQKARGITGSPSPVGDPFDIDYVAHEMGHQFGANHTFAGVGGSCGDPTNPQTSPASPESAMEPGSGSTIMAYAGICDNNVQNNSDDYFHARSIQQMVATVNAACVAGTANGNTPPAIGAIPSFFTIPKGTPFSLTGNATDANGDTLTYCWEQTNAATQNPLPTGTSPGPNFRSYEPTTSPKRYFPSLKTLTSEEGSVYEVLPTGLKDMTFALTVRDNRSPNGGQTSRFDTTVRTNTATGPFVITSQNTDNISWTQGSSQTITWNVAGTNAAPINTANVKISLSTDGGLTFPTVIAASTPNNGSYSFTTPNVAAPFCRIMIEAVGNIYFAVNTKSFAIGYTVTNTCNTYTNSTPLSIPDGTGTNLPGAVVASSISVPMTSNITNVTVNVNISHDYIQDLISAVNHPDNTQVFLFQRVCNNETGMIVKFKDEAPNLSCASTISGTYNPLQPLSAFSNKPANGTYSLLLRDYYAGDTGTLNSWSVEICSQTVTPLSTESFGLQDFKIYPNPNNGIFDIEFNSISGEDIKINIFDLSGRLILDKTYTNSGRFSKNIDLNRVQAGVYLVTVQDGKSKETRKIIIE